MPCAARPACVPRLPNVRSPASRRSPVVRAEKLTDEQQDADSVRANTGFRFDPAYNRWVRDDKMVGKEVAVKVQPKSGAAYTVWPVMHSDLVAKELTSMTPEQAYEKQQEGWTIVDVRLDVNYNDFRIAGSESLPLYRYVEGRTAFDNIKRFVMGAFFAMRATERDPDFVDKAKAAYDLNATLIVVCDIGGTLSTKREVAHKVMTFEVNDPERAFGRESRSLKACHALLCEAGFTNVLHLDGGIQQWKYQGYAMESS